MKDFSPNYFEQLFKNLKTKIRKAEDNGFKFMFI